MKWQCFLLICHVTPIYETSNLVLLQITLFRSFFSFGYNVINFQIPKNCSEPRFQSPPAPGLKERTEVKDKQHTVSVYSVYFMMSFTHLFRQPSLMDFVCKTSSMNGAAQWIINCTAVEYAVCFHLFNHFHVQ